MDNTTKKILWASALVVLLVSLFFMSDYGDRQFAAIYDGSSVERMFDRLDGAVERYNELDDLEPDIAPNAESGQKTAVSLNRVSFAREEESVRVSMF